MVIKNPSYKAMAVSSLSNALRTDPDSGVRCSAAEALGNIGSEEAIPALSEALKDIDPNVRRKASKALGKIGRDKDVSGNRSINTGGGDYYESISTGGGNYVQGNYVNMSQDLTQAAVQIQDLIEHLQKQGVTVDVAKDQVVQDIALRLKVIQQ